MGVFRLVMAATVMLGHYIGFYPHHLPYLMNGEASVPAFYIVSGFLITLVLREKYSDQIGVFYSNRALRIFPLYWAALIVFLVVNWIVVGSRPLEAVPVYQYTSALWWARHNGDQLGWLGVVTLALSNIFIFGQDVMLFIGKWPNIFTRDYFYHFFVFVGPAWTIAIEFWFYLLAPFVVRRGLFWPIAILACSLAARILVIAQGGTSYIVEYDFAPFEIAFFMMGSLAYRGFATLRKIDSPYVTIYTIAAPLIMILLTVFYLKIPFARPIYLTAATLCLPGIVLASRRSRLDSVCGELSYPVYLLHPIFTIFVVPGSSLLAEMTAVTSVLALSYVLVRFVDRPIDNFQQRRAKMEATIQPSPIPVR
jgi:peptidoglycan/LPS O-acetylase OafA/YrhL